MPVPATQTTAEACIPNSRFLLAALALVVLFTLIQIGALRLAFDKLGLAPEAGVTLLLVSLMGSLVNVPLFRMSAEEPDQPVPDPIRRLLREHQQPFEGFTTVAVNLGGCLLPLTFSAYLVTHAGAAMTHFLLAIAFVAGVAYVSSRPVPGLGIGIDRKSVV